MPVFQLTDKILFPHPDLAEENGLLAIGGDLRPERLIAAYRLGIFPWFSDGDPILWWFTSPRLVIFPEQFKVSKRLARYIKKPLYKVTKDMAFDQVIESCAEIREKAGEETWITREMIDAYKLLHKLGYGHSVECWQGTSLVGGLYGISLGKIFFGESMFSKLSNSSKIALAALVEHLRKKEFAMIDCQMTTGHLLQFGAKEISGRKFQQQLQKSIKTSTPDGIWRNDN